jgi:hypothetical protein
MPPTTQIGVRLGNYGSGLLQQRLWCCDGGLLVGVVARLKANGRKTVDRRAEITGSKCVRLGSTPIQQRIVNLHLKQ